MTVEKEMILCSLGLIGFGLQGAYTLKIGQMTLDIGGKKQSAAACGFVDACGYLGAVVIMLVQSWAGKGTKEYSSLFLVDLAVCFVLLISGVVYGCTMGSVPKSGDNNHRRNAPSSISRGRKLTARSIG